MSRTKIALAQIDVEIGQPAANRRRIVERIREAAGAQLVIFPECAITGYCFDSLEEASPFAEPLDGPSAEAIAGVCSETGAYAIVGFIERDGSAYYNAAMIVGPQGEAISYRKVHLPYLGVDRFLARGNRGFEVISLPFGKVGVNICYDSSFPEAARALKLMGAELIALPTNWPPGARRSPDFVINTRALENHINFVAVNRVGEERGWPFIGRSIAVDFNGDTLIEAGGEREEMITCELDLEAANNNRIINLAGSYEIDRLADRRPEFYGEIAKPWTRSTSGD
ncbi:MAG: carbon-nitrogen hydrolase family protein [Acidobacteriota bacterium]